MRLTPRGAGSFCTLLIAAAAASSCATAGIRPAGPEVCFVIDNSGGEATLENVRIEGAGLQYTRDEARLTLIVRGRVVRHCVPGAVEENLYWIRARAVSAADLDPAQGQHQPTTTSLHSPDVSLVPGAAARWNVKENRWYTAAGDPAR
jgi:hypothetical protein